MITVDNKQEFSRFSNGYSMFRTVDEPFASCVMVHI